MTSFASEAELLKYLAGEADGALDYATALIKSYCGWSIAEETTSYTVGPAGMGYVQLPTLHVTALTAVAADTSPIVVARSDEEFAATPMTWTPWGAVYGPFAAGTIISYTHGYNPVPNDIKAATLALAADIQAGGGGQVAAETILGYAVTYVAGTAVVPVTEILDRYKITTT